MYQRRIEEMREHTEETEMSGLERRREISICQNWDPVISYAHRQSNNEILPEWGKIKQ